MSDRQTRTRIVYIASAAHSGSTLLDLILGGHAELQSLGELKALSERRPRKRDRVLADRCTCGAANKLACAFWRETDERLRATIGTDLRALDLDAADDLSFVRNNRALFESARAAGGRPWLVDSSKNPRRLRRLLQCRAFDVYPIHLVRSPYGVVYSQLRKGRSTVRAASGTAACRLELEALLWGSPHLRMSYEDLARNPAQETARAMGWLGLDFDDRQLEWPQRTHHILCGNHMRFASTAEIRLDDEWHDALSPLQRAAIGGLTWPARLAARLAETQSSSTPR